MQIEDETDLASSHSLRGTKESFIITFLYVCEGFEVDCYVWNSMGTYTKIFFIVTVIEVSLLREEEVLEVRLMLVILFGAYS